MRKTKPKRVKGWVAVWPWESDDCVLRTSRPKAKQDIAVLEDDTVARIARVVEVRPGEVVVDVERAVEAVMQAYEKVRDRERETGAPAFGSTALADALRKVGVR